jgi:hypothetical protein
MNEAVEFGSPNDVPGTTTIWARLNSPDAVLMEHNVEETHSVCDADPRSMDQRRARVGRQNQPHRVRLPMLRSRLCWRHRQGCTGHQRRRLRRSRRAGTRHQAGSSRAACPPEAGLCVRRRDHAHLANERRPRKSHDPRSVPPRRQSAGAALHPVPQADRVRALPRPHLPVPRLQQTRPRLLTSTTRCPTRWGRRIRRT